MIFFWFLGSYEQSPRMVDLMGPDSSIDPSDSQLREDLADAMRESPAQFRDSGKCYTFEVNNELAEN